MPIFVCIASLIPFFVPRNKERNRFLLLKFYTKESRGRRRRFSARFFSKMKRKSTKKMPGWHSSGEKKSVCENSAIFEQFLFLDQNRHLRPFSTGPFNWVDWVPAKLPLSLLTMLEIVYFNLSHLLLIVVKVMRRIHVCSWTSGLHSNRNWGGGGSCLKGWALKGLNESFWYPLIICLKNMQSSSSLGFDFQTNRKSNWTIGLIEFQQSCIWCYLTMLANYCLF